MSAEIVSFPKTADPKTRWACVEVAHVVPVGDTHEHVYCPDCWCEPKLIPREPHGWIIVHAAEDGRPIEDDDAP